MITENYPSHTKDELLTEAVSRGLDVNSSSSKADIVAALEADDEIPIDTKSDKASGIPKIEDKDNIPNVPVVGRPKIEDYKGNYVRRSDGEPYALAVMKEGGEYGRTHFALNSKHEWAGSEAEFRQEFDKK